MTDPLTVACQYWAGSQEIIERKDAEIAMLKGDLEVMRLQRDAARQRQVTLTDAEREAVEQAADLIDAKTCGDSSTLRELLERHGAKNCEK